MREKSVLSGPTAEPRRAEPAGYSEAARPEHNNPATVEEFAREQMGIAAKE